MYAHLPTFPTFSVMATVKKYRAPLLLLVIFSLFLIGSCVALDFESMADAGSMSAALETFNELTPGVKTLVIVIAFFVAMIGLAALRAFGPALSFVGLAVFAAVALPVAGAVTGAVLP